MPDASEVRETRDLERRNHELSVLNEIARELNRSVELGEALGFTLSQVAELLGLRTAWIWLMDESSPEPYLAAARNLPPALADEPRRMDGSRYCYCLDTYKKGDLEGAANVNVLTCSRLDGLVDGTGGLRYHASIPLYAGEKKLGVMNVASEAWRGLGSEDLQLLNTVGDLLSIAVERARKCHAPPPKTPPATGLQIESAEALLETNSDPERVHAALDRALSLTHSNLDEARRAVLDLRASPLEDRPLPEALKALVDRWEAETGIPARFKAVNGSRPPPPGVEAALYRVGGGALNNAARHAAASRVTIRLVSTPEAVNLLVEDDGRGFDPSQVPEGRHGIVGMRERVEMLGGALRVDSGPEGGTRVEAKVPLGGFGRG